MEDATNLSTVAGVPETLSRHFGHLFIRDPLVIIEEFLHPTDETKSYHFEVRSLHRRRLHLSLAEFELAGVEHTSTKTTAAGRR